MFFIWHGLKLFLSKYRALILVSEWANPLAVKISVPNHSAFRKRNHACGQMIWIADAHRDDEKRYVVHADDILTAFLELESAIHQFAATCSRWLFQVAL